jgi:TonB family protein
MNKLMKFCGKCDEAFADRFSFCPNCGGELQIYEMNPVAGQASSEAQAAPGGAVDTPVILADAAAKDAEVLEIPEFEAAQSNGNGAAENTRVYALESEAAVEPAGKAETPPVPVAMPVSAPKHEVPPAFAAKDGWREVKSKNLVPADDGLYHITMVENKTVLNDPRLRATGIFALLAVLTIGIGGIVYDLFTQYVNVNSPDTYDLVSAVYINDDPVDIEKVPLIKDKDDGGGGGGGGRNDPNPASEGRMAPQFKDKPLLTPSKEDISVTDPALLVYRGTQGNKDYIPVNDGRPMGAGLSKIPSDGSGGPLGQGNGNGEGQGPGRGNGYGPGDGGGFGGGSGGGQGPGTGPGGSGDEPPPMRVGPTKPARITYQQKPNYTEEARKAQINGTVRLRVTFNANGTIGNVSQVSGLGYGLTEQAISAARNMRFEPAMKNGVAVTSTKVVEFNFNIY